MYFVSWINDIFGYQECVCRDRNSVYCILSSLTKLDYINNIVVINSSGTRLDPNKGLSEIPDYTETVDVLSDIIDEMQNVSIHAPDREETWGMAVNFIRKKLAFYVTENEK